MGIVGIPNSPKLGFAPSVNRLIGIKRGEDDGEYPRVIGDNKG